MTAESPFRALPSVDRLASHPLLGPLRAGAPPEVVAQLVREVLAEAREAIGRGGAAPSGEQLAEAVLHRAEAVLRPSLRPVINATGVIVHTNLGRAPLSEEAIAAMEAVSRGYSNLELDLESGERGSRHAHLEGLLCRLTGAEAALAVNNNAAAVLLALTALCQGREVVVSRGQAVEIGGGFRIPDILRQSGARLVEVGTTNRTYIQDYEAAIGPETAALLRVHTSNFRIVGFIHSVPLRDMAALAHSRGLIVIDDLGSGCLLDTAQFGLAHEPMPQESLRDGADLVCFSGDKLLGGPQAGIVLGRRDLVERLRRHPLARAVRLDKASIAALQATLLHYLRGEALTKVPVWRMVATPLREVERRARRWARALGPPARVMPSRSMVGGGSLPEEGLPTRVLAIPGEGSWLVRVARRLRLGEPPVVGRIEADALLLDPRTVDPRDDARVVEALRAALQAAAL
ncbi:MAG TPA: L-seryl-tRNA(Sec) selenium transferase [Dehalococcoidia bacterium]|nr:L-seryl-tRNA(Sec) selenium transferase [Dehalococcoidia bacterium]